MDEFLCNFLKNTDIPMSVGIIDTRTNPSQLNAVEFLWDPAKRTSAFIQVWSFYINRSILA